uniref:Uncharacterized protein n=1 Tax=Bionectria ochroleuca TaxID=29856 RepID=A0A8H7KAK6_BIOOC
MSSPRQEKKNRRPSSASTAQEQHPDPRTTVREVLPDPAVPLQRPRQRLDHLGHHRGPQAGAQVHRLPDHGLAPGSCEDDSSAAGADYSLTTSVSFHQNRSKARLAESDARLEGPHAE